ncbi:hypothetical protein D3C84_914580 [compost metagenome]
MDDPFCQGAEHLAKIDFLKGFAILLVASHLANEQNHRRGILERGVDADRGIGCPRASGDEADAWLAGEFAVGFGHIGRAAFLTADDQVDFFLYVMQCIEYREVALSRHTESSFDAVDAQGIHQNLTSATTRNAFIHCYLLSRMGRCTE